MDATSPQARYHIAEVGALLSDPVRVAILLALMDGTNRPAGELARIAGIAASTASAHLGKLVAGGLLSVLDQGRHRYYRITDERVAHMLESFSVNSTHSLRAPIRRQGPELLRARTCYNHVAGALGVALFEKLQACGGWTLNASAVYLSGDGVALLRRLELLGDTELPKDLPGRTCVDWTERRFHLGGQLGGWLASRLFEADWLRRSTSTRGLIATAAGRMGFEKLGVDWDLIGRKDSVAANPNV